MSLCWFMAALSGMTRPSPALIRENRPRVELKAYRVLPEMDGELSCSRPLRRNRRMLKDSGARVLIALPGNSGTANCISEALSMGLDVWEWQDISFVQLTPHSKSKKGE